jgi:Predicted permeases
MEYFIGFIIALFIALTGVGAGTVTVPMLVLFLKVPAPTAVAIGLMFSSVIKLVLVPTQVARKNVAWRTLGFMLLGGVPGVLAGSLFLRHLVNAGSQNLLNALLGVILVGTATWQLIYSFKTVKEARNTRDHSPLLAWLMFPVGAEVGFSSAGAGALGSAALLSLTMLTPAQVVGTDITFGFAMSLVGSGAHGFSNISNPGLLIALIIGGVFGAIAGTIMSTRIPKRPLRFALWLWLLFLGAQFMFNSYHVWAATR